MNNPERLGLDIKIGVAGGSVEEAKREMAVLANRLGITVHGELNDELCMACPGEDVARVYGKKRQDRKTCPHESMAANTDGDPQCRSCGLAIEPEDASPLLNPDQVAVMRHAMQAGLRSVPVFARAFDITFGEIEKILAEVGTPPAPKAEWETVCTGGPGIGDVLERWPVPRGWIYRSTQWSERDNDDPGPLERTESMTTVQE